MSDDAVQGFARNLADAALAIVGAFSVDFIDLDQRLNQVAFVGIPGRTIWIFESVFHLPYSRVVSHASRSSFTLRPETHAANLSTVRGGRNRVNAEEWCN